MNGIKYNTEPRKIHIHAQDNGKGEIISTIYLDGEYYDQGLVVNLVFKVVNPLGWDPIEDPVPVWKKTTGKPSELEMVFEFEIEPISSSAYSELEKIPLPDSTTAKVTVTKNGEYFGSSFGKLHIDRTGTYKYKVSEKLYKEDGKLAGWDIILADSPGWELDEETTEYVKYSKIIEFTVSKDSDSDKLYINGDPDKLLDVFYLHNIYLPIETDWSTEDTEPVPFTKKTLGLAEGETATFIYRIYDLGNDVEGLDHNPMPLSSSIVEEDEEMKYSFVTITEDNKEEAIGFGRFHFKYPGEYRYAIEELDLPEKWEAQPSSKQEFVLRVTGDETGHLSVEIVDPVVFTNVKKINHTDQEFVFKKIWTGYPGDPPAFSWTLYRDGEVADPQHQFIIDEDGNYHAYDMRYGDYYLIENVPQDFQAVYHNIGQYADITDRLYSGGVLENVYLPDTGDRDNPVKWMMLFGGSVLAIALLVIVTKRKQKTGKK